MSLPPRLARTVDRFAQAPKDLRVQALLQFSKKVPPLPPELEGNRDRLEQVHECQTPFFLSSEIDEAGAVHMHFDCPPESPTVRGFAGILQDGLEGESVDAVLAVPNDFYARMGLAEVVSPQRLRGFGAILTRLKRQVAERAGRPAPGGRPT